MIVAALLTVELLRFAPCSPRSEATMEALHTAAAHSGARVVCTDAYRGGSDLLVLWGPGHPARFDPMRRQVESGGHVLALDLAYWDRHRKVRFSFDAAHPQAWVMRRNWPMDRLTADGITVGSVWNPDGPVIIAGIGAKALVQYGDVVPRWEQAVIDECRARGRRVVYRPKRHTYDSPQWVDRCDKQTIDESLTGASLLVTWHSNAAVDAIRLGVPAVCRDGAAAAVCPSTLADATPLDPNVRDRFLANLAYFQWLPTEASAAWRWVAEMLTC